MIMKYIHSYTSIEECPKTPSKRFLRVQTMCSHSPVAWIVTVATGVVVVVTSADSTSSGFFPPSSPVSSFPFPRSRLTGPGTGDVYLVLSLPILSPSNDDALLH